MERSCLSVSAASNSMDIVERNIWNPMMELLFHTQIGGIFDLFVEGIDLARIALSCHFALDVLLSQGRCSRFRLTLFRGMTPLATLVTSSC